jgi:hypothetical protein
LEETLEEAVFGNENNSTKGRRIKERENIDISS